MGDENSFVFKVHVKDGRRIEQVQEMMDGFEIGDLEWDGFEVKRDKMGEYIEASASMSPKFAKKVEARIQKIQYVSRVKLLGNSGGESTVKATNDKCTSNRLLSESAVNALNVSVDYAISQLRLMKGHLATATEGNIRGRLVTSYEGDLSVGSSFSVIGKMRYHETNYPLTDATTITWYASRSNHEWEQVATGPVYTPIVEDAGKHINLVIHHKGISATADADVVRVSQELEDSTLLILKKKRSLRHVITCLTELPPEELSKAGKRGNDEVILNKKGLQFIKGGRTLYKEEHGQNAFIRSVRGEPDCATLHISGQVIKIQFASKEECVQFVMAARAYAAYDKVCLIASLPPVNKEVNPNVSIVNALIQCGSAVEPYAWDPAPEIEYELPDIDDSELNSIAKAIQSLVSDRRIKASTHACLAGMLAAISQGAVNAPLPKPQAWVEPESEDEPEEDPEEEAASIGAATAGPVSDAVYEKRVKEAPYGSWSITEDVYAKYKLLFDKGAENGVVGRDIAMTLFQQSKQPQNVIDDVIRLIAPDTDKFNVAQYILIVHILRKIKDGNTMFSTVPPEIAYILTGKNTEEEAAAPKSPKTEMAEKPTKKPAKELPPKPGKKPAMSEEEDETPDWSLPDSAVKKLRSNFAKVSEGADSIPAGKAIKVFMKSDVKAKDVGSVAKLVCNGQPKTINEKQFIAIMAMLGVIRKGASVPSSLPDAFADFLEEEKPVKELPPKPGKKPGKELSPKPGKELPPKPGKKPGKEEEGEEMVLNKATYTQLKKLFDKQTGGEETMAPALAVKTFKKSGVDENDVKAIMKMVLRGHKGPIEVGQFVVIMFILKNVREGAEVPSSLPASLKKFL